MVEIHSNGSLEVHVKLYASRLFCVLTKLCQLKRLVNSIKVNYIFLVISLYLYSCCFQQCTCNAKLIIFHFRMLRTLFEEKLRHSRKKKTLVKSISKKLITHMGLNWDVLEDVLGAEAVYDTDLLSRKK